MIQNISYKIPNNYYKHKNVSFKNKTNTLTNTNIGNCVEGYIGKVKVRHNNKEKFLNVCKKYLGKCVENYTITNDNNELIGTADLFIVRSNPTFNLNTYKNYIYITELRNFSRPGTKYHNPKLEYYKDIGTRLLQIAQKRSEEENCNGNIKLIPLKDSINWYKNRIGMQEEEQNFNNLFYLPENKKESLSKLQGGL